MEDGKALGDARPQAGTQLLGQAPERRCTPGRVLKVLVLFSKLPGSLVGCVQMIRCKSSPVITACFPQILLCCTQGQAEFRDSVTNLPPEPPKMPGSP